MNGWNKFEPPTPLFYPLFLSSNMLSTYGSLAKAVVFVVDSAGLQRDGVRAIAEYLFDVMVHPTLRARPLLILCNKQVGRVWEKVKRGRGGGG